MKKIIHFLIILSAAVCLLGGCASDAIPVSLPPGGETVSVHALKASDESGHAEDPSSADHLPQGFVNENGKWYYYALPGVRFKGWIQTEKGYSYYNEERVSGLVKIDGDTYYFPDGFMATGFQIIRNREYYFDPVSGKMCEPPEQNGWGEAEGYRFYVKDGKRVTGSQRIDGVLCIFDEEGRYLQGNVEGYLYKMGRLKKGYTQVDGRWYLADEEGLIQTGLQQIEEEWHYFLPDGAQGEGFFEDPEGTFYFAQEDGVLQSGFVKVDDKLRYFDKNDFTMVRDRKIDGFLIDAEGVCHLRADEITDANLDAYIDYLLTENGSTPRDIYDYVTKNYLYTAMDIDAPRTMAIHMFNNGYGACFHFCTITEMLLNRAGYRTQWVRGELGHRWLLVEMSPGVWRHMDTMRKFLPLYNLTDDELYAYHTNPEGVNFNWDRSKWTSTTTTGRGDGPPAEPQQGETKPDPTGAQNPTEPQKPEETVKPAEPTGPPETPPVTKEAEKTSAEPAPETSSAPAPASSAPETAPTPPGTSSTEPEPGSTDAPQPTAESTKEIKPETGEIEIP